MVRVIDADGEWEEEVQSYTFTPIRDAQGNVIDFLATPEVKARYLVTPSPAWRARQAPGPPDPLVAVRERLRAFDWATLPAPLGPLLRDITTLLLR